MSELSEVAKTTEHVSAVPGRSLNRQVILDEDEYTEALSQIIARDFFPSLVHLDATNNYLDALRTDDPTLINASVRQLQEISTPATSRYLPHQTPSQTPWATGPSDTPLHSAAGPSSERPPKRPRYDMSLSLDAFQARYTSEDNASFTQILDDENRRRRERYGWAWDAQKRVEAQRDKMLEARDRMLIEPAGAPGVREKLVIEATKPAGLLTQGELEKETETQTDDKPKAKEGEGKKGGNESEDKDKQVAVVDAKGKGKQRADEEEEKPMDVMAPKKDTRSAGVDGWKFKTRNSLMFPPDADVAPHESISSTTALPSRGEPKAIKYDNTRLPEQDEHTPSGMSEPPSPTRSRIEAAIAGTPYRPRSPTNNGFSLLPAMPSPKPSELGPAAVKQLMTWGTLNATPRIISSDDPADKASSDMPPPTTPFHIPAPSARESLGLKLSSNAAKSLRAKAALMNGAGSGLGLRTPSSVRGKTDGSMPPPNWTPRKADAAGALTPAAKRLLDRTTMGVAGSRRADVMGKAAGWDGVQKAKERDLNRVRWTPSPAPVARRR